MSDKLDALMATLPEEEREVFYNAVEDYRLALEREKAQSGFMNYVRMMWPGFVHGRHHAVMAKKFEAIANGTLKRLIINMPPRHTKSEFASYLLPSWFLGRYPNKKIIQTSNTSDLAVNFGRKVRNLVDSEQYARVFPGVALRQDSKSAGRWATNQNGEYFAIGVGGTVTGKGADLLIIDDPHSEQEAALAAGDPGVFDKTYEWYTSGPRQRLQPGGAIVVVMTRWAERDLTGRVLKDAQMRDSLGEWEVVEFPAIMPSGNPLWPEFWSAKELEALREELPPSKWNAQYQQAPTGEEGALVKREWWKIWNPEDPPKCEFIIQSWDTAFTKNERSDYSACTTWGVFHMNDDPNDVNVILLDAFQKRMEFPELKEKAMANYREWEPDACIIEAKAAGAPLVFELRSMGLLVSEYTPSRGNDKFVRLNSVTDLFRSGKVWAPETRWASEVIEQMAAFPNGEHDDLVDSSTQALIRFRQGGFLRLDSDEREELQSFSPQSGLLLRSNMIEQSLSQAPMGLESLVGDSEPVMEIEIENPEGLKIGMDGMVIDMLEEPEEESFDENLAEVMDPGTLAGIASDIIEMVDSDINSRKEWVEMYVKGLDVLGMKYEERTEPWNGACGVFSTILTEAAVRFQSETILETFPAQGPVKTEIIGAIDKLKEDAAERVREDMNFQLTEAMPEYRPEHERMLYSLGLAGAAFKKVYFDPSYQRQVAIFIPAEDFIIPYGASSVINAERVTHVMRKTKNDIKKLQVSGFYRDVDLGEPVSIHTDVEKKKAEDQGYSLTDDDRYQILEVHIDYDLPGYEDEDGIALPYVITIDRGTTEVLSIRRNWSEDDTRRIKRQHFVQYTYVPGFGAYGLGLIHLIGGYARAGTSILRQLVDAGTLSNLPGGLKSRGLRIKGDDTPISPGEFRDVDVPSGTVRDNIMTLPYKEPSQVLSLLLDKITQEGRRLGSIADMQVSDMSANAPVGTTLALLERQLKNMSAVQARVHYSMKQEFKLLRVIIRDNTPGEYEFDPSSGDRMAKREDYDMVDVIPVSDPNSSTMAQRIMQYQAVIQLAQQAPQIYNVPVLHRQMIEVLGIKNADKLVPIEDDMKPRDPVSENMAFLNGEPTKAFIYQDHDAHIAVHTSMMQDPLLMAQIGQNPQAQKMMAEIQAHIAEHLAYAYRKKVEEQLGVPMPAPDSDLPEESELMLSRLVAQAATQLLAQSKGQVQQQQAQQMAQDPVVQMQQAELAIRKQDAETKLLKVKGDLQLKAEELSLKARESAAKTGEDPAMAAMRLQQEIMQAQELHGLEIAAKQMELQQAQAQQQQAAMQQQQTQQQAMAHGGQVHAQKLSHTDQAHAMKMRQAATAAKNVNNQNTSKDE